jgi:hypothetical protein
MTAVGIYAPYRLCEQTDAALTLAETALSFGLEPRLASDEPVVRGVNPPWDTKVRRLRSMDDVVQWARGCDRFVWFVPSRSDLSRVKGVCPDAQHILVPSWHRLDEGKLNDYEAYRDVVVPSRAAQTHFQKWTEIRKLAGRRTIKLCHWDSGVIAVPRATADQNAPPRLLVHADASAVDDLGAGLIACIEGLFDRVPDLQVTLYREKTWPIGVYRQAANLAHDTGGRLTLTSGDRLELLDCLPRHDWAFVPSTRVDFGTAILRAEACGVPTVTYDVPPASEVLCHSGLSLSCELVENWFGAPVAVPFACAAVPALAQRIMSPPRLPANWAVDRLEARRSAFRRFWSQQWDIL